MTAGRAATRKSGNVVSDSRGTVRSTPPKKVVGCETAAMHTFEGEPTFDIDNPEDSENEDCVVM